MIDFITADKAREISLIGRWEYLNEEIRKRANDKLRHLPLNGKFRLSSEDKRMLQEKGFTISEGSGGKCGKFDIIHW